MEEDMTITMTLSEALHRCRDWLAFCDEFGWSEWACNEGGGDIEVHLSEEEAIRHGLMLSGDNSPRIDEDQS
jgi:hypothetical protein